MHFDMNHNAFVDTTNNGTTLGDVISSRSVNTQNSMEIDKPDTAVRTYGEARCDVYHSRTECADPFAPVYGSTFGNAPLAIPSTGIEEQLSMDQYTLYESSSYMSKLKQQQFRDKDVPQKSTAAYKWFKTLEQRKGSFTSRWPHSASVQNVDKMVRYGFFYTGNDDLIKCFYCGIGLKDWSNTDDPMVEHVRYAPDCQFLVDTVPPTLLTRIKASGLPNTIVSTRESVSIGHAEPATPSGSGDRVRCYACDGGLQKWSPEDNAWVEHARWFDHCAYLKHMKGQDFIDLVRLSVEHQRLEEEGARYIGEGGQDVTSNESSEYMYWKNNLKTAEEEIEMARKHEPQTADELEAETEQLRSVVKCLMCEENDANCLYLPCAHHRLCVECSTNIALCPICQRKIHSKVKTFMS